MIFKYICTERYCSNMQLVENLVGNNICLYCDSLCIYVRSNTHTYTI